MSSIGPTGLPEFLPDRRPPAEAPSAHSAASFGIPAPMLVRGKTFFLVPKHFPTTLADWEKVTLSFWLDRPSLASQPASLVPTLDPETFLFLTANHINGRPLTKTIMFQDAILHLHD